MAVTTFTLPYTGTPPYFSGSATSSLVPSVFPVGIDGRPYMVDVKSGRFGRAYEQRVRDSQDTSTSPGEAAINPGGLWRRGQASWHFGAGQKYADSAGSQDYRFYKSKGINPWVKGQLSLLNATKSEPALVSANTNLFMCVVKSSGGTNYLYVADGSTLKYTTDPFATSPTWTSVTTGSPGTAITGLETNGTNVFIAYTSNDIYYTTPGSSSVTFFYPTGGSGTGKTYRGFGYAKGWGWASVDNNLYVIGIQSGSHSVHWTAGDSTLRFVGAAAGSNAVYVGSYSGTHSIVYRVSWDPALNSGAGGFSVPVAALELPVGEIISSIHGYLGYILLGTNKGVRFCTTDDQSNLVAGPIIPTSGPVYDFIAEDKYVWFTWSNYDGVSGGLGRLDLSTFTQTNAPAYATDLMYDSTANVLSCTEMNGKRIFSVSGVGVIVENSSQLVASGEVETGIWRWGIPDRKFVAKIDTRATPLAGSITQYLQLDEGDWDELGVWESANTTEDTIDGSDEKAIEAAFKFKLSRSATTTSAGPTMTRWMARAYAAPSRSQQFSVPLLLHNYVRVRDKEYFVDVAGEQRFFDELIASPRLVNFQLGATSHTCTVEDVEWVPIDSFGSTWDFEGTLVVTLRSVEN